MAKSGGSFIIAIVEEVCQRRHEGLRECMMVVEEKHQEKRERAHKEEEINEDFSFLYFFHLFKNNNTNNIKNARIAPHFKLSFNFGHFLVFPSLINFLIITKIKLILKFSHQIASTH